MRRNDALVVLVRPTPGIAEGSVPVARGVSLGIPGRHLHSYNARESM